MQSSQSERPKIEKRSCQVESSRAESICVWLLAAGAAEQQFVRLDRTVESVAFVSVKHSIFQHQYLLLKYYRIMDEVTIGNPNIFTSTPPPVMDVSVQNSSNGRPAMEILAAVFFVVAGTWLILALMYSCLVLWFLRLRSRGEIDRIYEEDFGRIYIYGDFYLPLGCMFRRYIQHLQNENNPRPHQYMTLPERRKAMNRLLHQHKRSATAEDIEGGDDDGDDPEENVCSICLACYESSDVVFRSDACQHQFHWDCLLDWLQRPGTTECPCCRIPLVGEENVWNTVRQVRKEKKREVRKRSKDLKRNTSCDSTERMPRDTSQREDLTVTTGES
jgi:hypothetical protein